MLRLKKVFPVWSSPIPMWLHSSVSKISRYFSLEISLFGQRMSTGPGVFVYGSVLVLLRYGRIYSRRFRAVRCHVAFIAPYVFSCVFLSMWKFNTQLKIYKTARDMYRNLVVFFNDEIIDNLTLNKFLKSVTWLDCADDLSPHQFSSYDSC